MAVAAQSLVLADADTADLPRLYDYARAALVRCEQIDECRDWSSKAAALKSYARQAGDRTLIDIATRIQARAVRRVGELLQAMPQMRGRHGAPDSRTSIARAAGLSSYQQAVAIQVAQVPRESFDRQVDGPCPPAVTRLAEQGTRGTWTTVGKARASLVKRIHKLAGLCGRTNAAAFRGEIAVTDVRAIIEWCEEFLEHK